MGGTGPCGPMKIIFSSLIQVWCTSLNVKFGTNRTFYQPKTPVYHFDLYGRYRTLWADEDNFWQYYLELLYTPKYQIWCESDFVWAQDPGIPVWFIWEVTDPVDRYSHISYSYSQNLSILTLPILVVPDHGVNRTIHVLPVPISKNFDYMADVRP